MDTTSLIFGFLLGIVFILIIIAITLYILNKRFIKNTLASHKIDDEEIKKIISKKQKKIMKSPKVGIGNNVVLMQDLSKDLIYEIAQYYYPESSNPHLEINLMEALDLNERVTERLKKLIDTKTFGMLKHIRIAQIVTILEFKKSVENNPVYQFSKKYKLDKLAKYGYTAFNAASPTYWLRRLIFTSTLETSLRGIGIMTINIIGEESSKLYSKKIVDTKTKELDKEVEKLIKELESKNNNRT